MRAPQPMQNELLTARHAPDAAGCMFVHGSKSTAAAAAATAAATAAAAAAATATASP